MVTNPEDYPWSGHRTYLGKELIPWLTTDWMLKQLGKSVTKTRKGYSAFVLDGLEDERRPEFHGAGADSRLLGDDSFMDKCLSGSEDCPLRLTAQQIADKVCLAYEINLDDLKSQAQERAISETRAVAGWLALELGCVTLKRPIGRRYYLCFFPKGVDDRLLRGYYFLLAKVNPHP